LIECKVIKCISDTLSIDVNDIGIYTTMEELSSDIIDTISIVMNIEEIFEININDDEVESLATVQDIVDLVEDKI